MPPYRPVPIDFKAFRVTRLGDIYIYILSKYISFTAFFTNTCKQYVYMCIMQNFHLFGKISAKMALSILSRDAVMHIKTYRGQKDHSPFIIRNFFITVWNIASTSTGINHLTIYFAIIIIKDKSKECQQKFLIIHTSLTSLTKISRISQKYSLIDFFPQSQHR